MINTCPSPPQLRNSGSSLEYGKNEKPCGTSSQIYVFNGAFGWGWIIILPVPHNTSTMLNSLLFFRLLIVFSIAVAGLSDSDCVFTVYVRTGSVLKAGTDSIISLRLYDANGLGVEIPNLELWGGIMEPGHNYYERGNLDIFSGRAPCLSSSVCAMNLTSDGSGAYHGWYVNYVEVTTTGVHAPCAQQLFTVEQWLATDTYPYELTAIRNNCDISVDRLSHALMKSSSSSSSSASSSM